MRSEARLGRVLIAIAVDVEAEVAVATALPLFVDIDARLQPTNWRPPGRFKHLAALLPDEISEAVDDRERVTSGADARRRRVDRRVVVVDVHRVRNVDVSSVSSQTATMSPRGR